MVQLIKLILVWVILVAVTNKTSFFINLWFKQTLQVIDHCRCFEVHQWLYSSWWNQDTESLPLDLWQSFGFPWIQLAFRGKEEFKLFPWELHILFGITVSLENYSKRPIQIYEGLPHMFPSWWVLPSDNSQLWKEKHTIWWAVKPCRPPYCGEAVT